MKKYVALAVSLMLVFLSAGCQKRQAQGSAREQESPQTQAVETAPEEQTSPQGQKQGPEKNNPAVARATLNGEEVEIDVLQDNNPETQALFEPGDKLRLEFPEERVNSLKVFSAGEAEFAAEIKLLPGEGSIFKITEIARGGRWCALWPQDAVGIEVTFLQKAALGELTLQNLAPEKEMVAVAYWPVTAVPGEQALAYAGEATDFILNTGCYWQEDGALAVEEALTKALAALKEIPRQERPKIWCTINPKGALIRQGTAGSTIASPEKRQALTGNIASFCRENQIDGVDIDWEFPQREEWPDFSAFLVELSQELAKDGRELSAAFYPKEIYLTPQAIAAISRVNVMAYDQFDQEGRHATYQTAREAVDYFTGLGFQPQQLCLGIPAYGRPLDGSAAWPFYSEAQLGPGENMAGNAYYNGPQLARDKAAFAAAEGMQGVVVYHLGCDLPGKQGLLGAAAQFYSQAE